MNPRLLHSRILIFTYLLEAKWYCCMNGQVFLCFHREKYNDSPFLYNIVKVEWDNFLILWRFLRSSTFFHSGLNCIYLLWPVPMCIICNRHYDLSCNCDQTKINIFFLLSTPLFCTVQILLCWFTFVSLLWLITLIRIKVYTSWEKNRQIKLKKKV